MPGPPPKVLADLARVWASHSEDDLRAALELLRDPEAVRRFAELLEQTLEAGAKVPRPKRKARDRQSEADRLTARLDAAKLARPNDADLLDRVAGLADRRWTKARQQDANDLLEGRGLQPITATSKKARWRQLVRLVEARPPRALLSSLLQVFSEAEESAGSLSEWADIIHPKSR